MAWTIEFRDTAERQLARLDRAVQQRIVRFLEKRIATNENPRRMGKPLHGSQHGLWRYRVGDYRLICQIQDDRMVVLVLKIGHRSDVYR